MDLITDAYNVKYEQVSGAPDWGRAVRWDIQSKVPSERQPTREQVRQMLQSLLSDRFKLSIRRETGEVPVYALVPAKGGPRLRPSEVPTGVRVWATDAGRHMEGSVTMEFLSRQLSNPTGRLVVDRTGLTGTYGIALEWTPDGFTPPDNTTPTSIFTAIQEQLGLKLETTKAPVEKLVIEQVEKPELD